MTAKRLKFLRVGLFPMISEVIIVKSGDCNNSSQKETMRHVVGCYLLCHIKSKLEIAASAFRVELLVVKCSRVEVMHDGTESHTIIPAAGEVCDVHILYKKK